MFKTNVTVCSGGIIGMGERMVLNCTSTLNPQPESVPINALVARNGRRNWVEIWE
jgi:biotin synthase